MTTTTTALPSIQIGDEIEILCDGFKARRVVVTGRMESGNLLVTSGKTRSCKAGGYVADYGLQLGLMYQPTLTQNIRRVDRLTVVRRAEQRN